MLNKARFNHAKYSQITFEVYNVTEIRMFQEYDYLEYILQGISLCHEAKDKCSHLCPVNLSW